MAYFVMKDIQTARGVALRGDMIVPTEIEFDSSDPKASAEAKPKPKIPKLIEVKWILPPKGSKAYEAAKKFAGEMGYDTVEHDDFSYPDREV